MVVPPLSPLVALSSRTKALSSTVLVTQLRVTLSLIWWPLHMPGAPPGTYLLTVHPAPDAPSLLTQALPWSPQAWTWHLNCDAPGSALPRGS